MKRWKGGYALPIRGKPSRERKEVPEADYLYLPLRTRRFNFSALNVGDGDSVRQGQIMAHDPDNYMLPLIAPRGGIAKLEKESACIILEQAKKEPDEKITPADDIPPAAREKGSNGTKRYLLFRCGAWHYFSDADTGNLPDPFGSTPRAIIVSTFSAEPFLADPGVVTLNRMNEFARGLEYLHELAENRPIYCILASASSQIKEVVKKYAWITVVEVPYRYPFGNPKLMAQNLKLNGASSRDPVWAIGAEGVVAVEHVLTQSMPWLWRTISLSGPGVQNPVHASVIPGYPLDTLLKLCEINSTSTMRIINGGVFTGRAMDTRQKGIDVECQGLTVLPEKSNRDFLGFARFGIQMNSYSKAFVSAIIPGFRERATTGIRGEKRPCVSCGFCEEVCAARIMPFQVYRYVENNRLEEAQRFGLQLCVGCGLCSYVCLSKIDVCRRLIDAQEIVRKESSGGTPVK